MTRARWVILIFLICATAGIIAGVASRERQPYYRGKSLSEWLRLKEPTWTGEFPEENIEALNHIGTNAVPYLLKTLNYRPPRWRRTLARNFNVPYLKRVGERENDRQVAALAAFGVLGPQARSAIPELTRLTTNRDNVICLFASQALGEIGYDSIPVIVDLLTNLPAHTNFNPAFLVNVWIALGTNATSTIPTLLQCLEDHDSRVADTSQNLLDGLVQRKIGIDIILPGLCKKLFSTSELARGRAARLLRPFQYDPSTLLYLRKAMEDPDPQVRAVAGQTVRDFRELEPLDQSASNKVTNAPH